MRVTSSSGAWEQEQRRCSCYGGEKRSGEARSRRFEPRAAGETASVQGNFLKLKVIHESANFIGDGQRCTNLPRKVAYMNHDLFNKLYGKCDRFSK